jgi:6-phosphogluconolactonase
MQCSHSHPNHHDVRGHHAQHAKGKTGRWPVWLLPLTGLVSLVWFCVRVIPKPSRALYPCQRAAMPLASGFVAWLLGLVGCSVALNKGRRLIRQSRWPLALACLGLAAALGIMAVTSQPQPQLRAAEQQGLSPIGEAKGIHPGRVVWVHDPNATNWEGPGHGHPWEAGHTNPVVCDRMMSRAIHELTGEATNAKAWDALFRFHNKSHNKGDVGYTAGQKIAIKVNFVGFIKSGNGVDPQTYAIAGQQDYMNTSPQIIAALLRQLTQVAGVRQADIGVGDGSALFPNEYYDLLHRQFPDVKYLDGKGGPGRTLWDLSTVPLYWSCRPQGVRQDFIPKAFAEAEYLINLATLKGHTGAGVTLCAKNHYGSLGRMPPERGYYDLHKSAFNRGTGQYRNLVDLMGHSQIGGKTVLYLIDGLYCGTHMRDQSPRRWASAPFNGDWTSSLFASEDPVAIDSVGVDFLQVDQKEAATLAGTDDYLREAALANSPASGTFYDPDHAANTVRLASLGVHEHWNNPTDRQYSRNLGKDAGIELVQVRGQETGQAKAAKAVQVYIGTYTGKGSEGIYLADLDLATGELKVTGKTTGLENPSFLAMDPAGRWVYAVRESNKGAVVALSRDAASGGLTILNEQPSGGQGPCYVAVDHTGKFVLTANYGSGSVAVLPVGQDGSLQPASSVDQHTGSSANPARQKGPHAHCIDLSPDNRFALAADLGTDRVCVYRFDSAAGKLTANDPAYGQSEPGAGPRHLAFHPNGKWVYVIEEMGSTITSYAYDAGAGTLKSTQRISTLPTEFRGSGTCAEVQVHPSGRFLYGSNRGHNSIACFAIEAATGQLRLIGHEPTQGNTPRHFAIDPSGQWLLVANQDSNTIVSLRVNPDTGKLSPTGQVCQVANPVCILIASR